MKYPAGIKKEAKQVDINYKNRGMNLENDLNLTNAFYRHLKVAFIYKKPTPIKITKVEYKNNKSAVIKEAFFEMPSTTDYNGLYKGKYIDFEAKETTHKTSFPLSNIHPHQIEHLKSIIENKGIGFLIVRFTTIDQTFLLKGEDFLSFLENENRKSIPLTYFQLKGYLIKDKYEPRVDYLEIVDQLYGGI